MRGEDSTVCPSVRQASVGAFWCDSGHPHSRECLRLCLLSGSDILNLGNLGVMHAQLPSKCQAVCLQRGGIQGVTCMHSLLCLPIKVIMCPQSLVRANSPFKSTEYMAKR